MSRMAENKRGGQRAPPYPRLRLPARHAGERGGLQGLPWLLFRTAAAAHDEVLAEDAGAGLQLCDAECSGESGLGACLSDIHVKLDPRRAPPRISQGGGACVCDPYHRT